MSKQVKADVSTHFPNLDKGTEVKPEYQVTNSQSGDMLIDPEDVASDISTHSAEDIKINGPKKAPVSAKKIAVDIKAKKSLKADTGAESAPLVDKEKPAGGKIAEIPNDQDPAAGYLEADAEDEMPVIENSADEEFDADHEEFAEDDGDEFADDAGEVEAGGEFDDLPAVNAADDAADAPIEDADDDSDAEFDEDLNPVEGSGFAPGAPNQDQEMAADFENLEEDGDAIPLVDADGVADDAEGDVAFASIGASVHVIRANRIIASMGPKAAARAKMSDLYQTEQFHDVVAATIEAKGLRKGLVQSGFVLSKVKVQAVAAKSVKAKVTAEVDRRMSVLSKNNEALEQSLAIAAVGINKHFFKDANNALKAGLEVEFERLGVRGASKVIRAMFARHGVDYAKAILSVAKKISAMPQDVRDNYVEALDMTGDSDFEESDMDVDEVADEEDDGMEEIQSITASLSRPLRRDTSAALLRASNGNSEAMQILSGSKSLV